MDQPNDHDVVAELRARADAVQPDGPFDELAVLRKGRSRLAARRGTVGALTVVVAVAGAFGTIRWGELLDRVPHGAQAAQTAAPDDAWDPHSWAPTETITPVPMSEAAKEARRADGLAGMARDLGLGDPPQVDLVRWTEGLTDHGTAVAACLTDAGFDSGVWTGTTAVSRARTRDLELASYVCEAEFTLDPALAVEWTPVQLRLLFDYWTQFYVPCLEAHGATVGWLGQPDKGAWVRAWTTPDRNTWWPPDDLLVSLPDREQAALKAACAPYPPDDVLFGS